MVSAYTRVQQEPKIPGVKTLRLTGATGLEDDPGRLRHGSNSGYQAINLAYHFGAKRIVLLGMDMHTDGHCHWRKRTVETTPGDFNQTLRQTMLPKFNSLVEPLREVGVEVFNATPGSALTCWPLCTLEEFLHAESV
jgi:hypothetical protein